MCAKRTGTSHTRSATSSVACFGVGGRAQPDAIRYAKLWTCPVCAQMQAPKLTRQAMLWPDDLSFNHVVSLDLLTIHDCKQQDYVVLSMVDWTSRYHVATIIKAKGSAVVAKKICQS